MAGENIFGWSTTALTNSSVDSSINFAEGQLPSTVNNSARSVMAAIARYVKDNGALTTTGSANAYLLTVNGTYAALATGLRLAFKASFANSGAATLAVTAGAALTAKALRKYTSAGDSALASGNIIQDAHYLCEYDAAANSAAGAWIVLNPTIIGADVTGAALTKTDDTNVTVTLAGSASTGMLRATSITLGWTGTLQQSRGGFGQDVSASSGVPLFTTGTAAFTSTSGTGNFARVANPTFTANVTLPLSVSSSTGVLTKAGTRFLHDYTDPTANAGNLFLGAGSGNFTVGPGGGAASLGASNTGLGYQTLSALTTGYNNAAGGAGALQNSTTANHQAAFGYNALQLNTTGYDNAAFGAFTLDHNTVGYANVAVGFGALSANTGGDGSITACRNVAVGVQALITNTTGYNNSAVGVHALNTNLTGIENVAFGLNAGYSNSTGNYNVSIGNNAGYGALGSNNVFLGYAAGQNATGSNEFYVGNIVQASVANDRAYSLLYGVFSGSAGSLTGQSLRINGSLIYAGVTLNNAVTGTGDMVLKTSPTLVTPTLGAATATTINGAALDNNAWTSYTPTITGLTGGSSTASGRYKIIGKTIVISLTLTVAGSPTGSPSLSLPSTAASFSFELSGREGAATGKMWNGHIASGASTASLQDYTNSGALTAGWSITVTGVYEAA